MKYRLLVLIALFISLAVSSSAPGPEAPEAPERLDGWEEVVPGIHYQRFVLPDPNQVYVARMDRSMSDLTLDSALGQGRISGGTERMTDMYARYDQAISYWGQTWGSRNRVVVAINGSFFNFGTGVPEGGQIHSGWYAKRFTDLGGGSGLAWLLNPSQSFIGGCITHSDLKNFLTRIDTGQRVGIDGVNEGRNQHELILYTPQYDTSTLTPDQPASVEVLVEVTRPTLVLPENTQGTYVAGTVVAVRENLGSTLIPFDHVVISARGDRRDELMALNLAPGDQVGINQEITHHCPPLPPSPGSWVKAYGSITGYPVILRDGQIPDFEAEGVTSWDVQEPRTTIAFNDAYVYFVVVDGRNPGASSGMSYPQLAVFLRDTLGATWAINQDGGGSSTMVIDGKVVNNTYCNHVDCSQDDVPPPPSDYQLYLPVAHKTGALQRFVANGMMMIVVEEKFQSEAFNPGTGLLTTEQTAIRLGPGTNYGLLLTVPADKEMLVIDHANGMNGIQAKGYHWWKVNYGGVEGWIREESVVSFLAKSQIRDLRLWEKPAPPGLIE